MATRAAAAARARAGRATPAAEAAGAASGAKAAGIAPPFTALPLPHQALVTAAARAVAVPADAHRAGYVAGLAAFALL